MEENQVGGQGLLNGIIINGKCGIAKAIRKNDGKIDLRLDKRCSDNQKKSLRSFPFFRGIYILIDAMNTGVNGLNVSEDIIKDILTLKQIKMMSKYLKITRKKFSRILVMCMASFISIFAFILMPVIITAFIKYLFDLNEYVLASFEGLLSIIILVLYLCILGKNKDIDEMFKYHGAEHKSIFCYENGKELNIENVKMQSRFHIRCGTNLLFVVFLNCAVVNLFIPYESIIVRIILKFLIIPIIMSVSYEVVRYISKSKSIISMVVAYPGLQLQRLTTREPEDKQLENQKINI